MTNHSLGDALRVQLFDCPVDILTMAETVDIATRAMRERRPTHHVAINVAKLVNMRDQPDLKSDVAHADIAGIDGMGIILALKLKRVPVPERVPGVDLMQKLLAVCAQQGFRPYFLGAEPSIVAAAAAVAQQRYPNLQFAGIRDGYFKPADEPGIVAAIRASGADCLFVGMPTPAKERFLAAHRAELGVAFIMGVGGSFDILAGKTRRAPESLQRSGLEWLYRIYQEPRRMWWRYARTNLIFARLLLASFLRPGSAGASL